LLISELDQPEAVAATGGSELLVGNGILYRIFATTDALWVLASDGLWRVSGEYPDWRVDPIDDKLLLCSRNSADMLKGKIWAKTNRSLVRISDAGIEEISTDIVDDLITKEVYSDTWNTSVVCDEENSEVNVITINSTSESVAIVYNAHQERFTSTNFVRSGDTYSTAHAYVPYLREMVWGAVQASAADIIRSSSATNTRMGGESVKFQPITGDGDPNTLKEFIDCTYLFTTNSSGFAILPSFNGTAFPSDLVVSIPYTSTKPDGKGLAGIPTELSSEEVSVSNSIAPGFSISTVGSNPAWTLKSISLRWKLASEETF
jgi:hypothetical protein